MFYLPFIGAIALGVGTIFEKLELMKENITSKWYTVAHFLFIMIVALPFLYFFWDVKEGAFSYINLFIFFLIIISTLLANLTLFYAFKRGKLNNLEPARAVEPFFVIILALIFSFFFGEELFERNTRIFVPALIAGGALVFAHVKEHHLVFNKPFIATIAASFFFSLDLILSRLILDFYNPITFYFIRVSALFVFSFLLFKPKFSDIDKNSFYNLLGAGICWFGYRVTVYYGYLELGVVFTTLLIMLGPMIVFILAHFILKEKMDWKNIVAAIIITGCIVYTILP